MFEDVFPYYLSIGMTYELFWLEEPKLVISYRKADEISRRRQNGEMWVNGMYTAEALAATVGNMFAKGNKHKYPDEPFPITEQENRERIERAQKAKMEKMKALFTAKALAVNAKMGGEK